MLFGRRGTVDCIEGFEHRPNLVAREAVEDRLALTPRPDQALKAHLGEVLGNGRLAKTRQAGEFTDRTLAFDEMA